MTPRLGHDIGQERGRHLGQANQHRWIVSIVLGEEERSWVELHQDLALADRRQLENENRIVVAEAGEKPAIQKKRWHSIRPALDNVR